MSDGGISRDVTKELRYLIGEGWTPLRVTVLVLSTLLLALQVAVVAAHAKSGRDIGFVLFGISGQMVLSRWWAAWRRL